MEMHTKDSLRLTHGIDGDRRDGFSFRRWLVDRIRTERDSIRRQRDLERLLAKSDHELRDVGLTRGEVEVAYRNGWSLFRRSGEG